MLDPRTKIVCTCGPACAEQEVLTGMIRAGADVFRVNGAHADEAEIGRWVERVRAAARSAGRHAGVLVDLPGPKFRIGSLEGGRPLAIEAGRELRMDADPAPGDARRLPLRSMSWFADLPRGQPVVLGDGSGRLEVLTADAEGARLRVLEAAEVREGMGVSFPGVGLPTAVPTRRDRELLAAAVAAGADMISQSFVRSADDVGRLQERLDALHARQTLAIAKVERVDAVQAIDRIAARADGILIGRGDLGIDAGVQHVPSLQRRILEAGRRAGCPVIVATEMLESMVRSPRPTRAEASDVAGAVFEGADGVMLSAETAIGREPVHVVRTMADILRAAEEDPGAPYAGRPGFSPLTASTGRPDQHVVQAAVSLARTAGAVAIVVFTREGASAVRLSKERPSARIHAFAPTDEVCRRLTLAWGVRPERLPANRGTDEIFQHVREKMYGEGDLQAGDRVVLVMGSVKDPAGATTLIKLFTA